MIVGSEFWKLENTQKMLLLMSFWIFMVMDFLFLNNCLFNLFKQRRNGNYYNFLTRSTRNLVLFSVPESKSWLSVRLYGRILWIHHCPSSLSATTVFVFSLNVSIERFELLLVQRTLKLFHLNFLSEYKFIGNTRKV